MIGRRSAAADIPTTPGNGSFRVTGITAYLKNGCAVNEIIAKRMNKKQQMRWNRTTVQSFLDVGTAVLNDNLEDDFRHRHPGFRPTNDDRVRSEAV
jgi:hypothetical protein